jgi:hypothetical protein
MALFRAYFDDSGTHKGSKVVVLGGLIGLDSQWGPLVTKWTAKLAAPFPDKPRLSKFHLSSCMAGAGEFQDYNLVEREALSGEFRDLIIEAKLGSTASRVCYICFEQLHNLGCSFFDPHWNNRLAAAASATCSTIAATRLRQSSKGSVMTRCIRLV